MKLENKIALVTGPSTGVGAATCQRFCNEGAKVFGVGAAGPKADAITGDFTFVECDNTDEAGVQTACAKVVEAAGGKLDILVTVSEKYVRTTCAEADAATITDAFKAIVLMPMLFSRACNDALHASGAGSIVHDVPIDVYMTEKNFLNSSLGISVVNYTRQACSQQRPVRVNSVLFGKLSDHLLNEEEVAALSTPESLAKIPAGRLGTSADVAGLNTFLASDKAGYLNSGAWTCDGGYYTTHGRSMGNNGV